MVDYCIIGGGVIGTAIARELSRYNASIMLVEAENDVCTKTSGANSAIIHAGYDAPTGSKMAYYNVLGSKLFKGYAKVLDVPYKKTGSLVVSFSKDEDDKIKQLYDRGIANGVKVEIIEKEDILKLQPNISNNVRIALYAPDTALIDPFELTFALKENAEMNGVNFKYNFEVKKVEKNGDSYVLYSDNDSVEAKYVINVAGNNGGKVARLFGEKIQLNHRLGEYLFFDKSDVVSMPIFKTPSISGKGVLVCPTLSGNIFIGPTAVDIADASTNVRREAFEQLREAGKLVVDNIEFDSQITSFAGVRALPDCGDFIIGWSNQCKNLYNIIGICSPGLSSVPAIANKVVSSFKLKLKDNFIPQRKAITKLKDVDSQTKKLLIKQDSRYGNIVCRCECVTEAEVVEAIQRGAKTVDGVKRRLRAGMGRCQGGFCLPNIVKILARELGVTESSIRKNTSKSSIVIGDSV